MAAQGSPCYLAHSLPSTLHSVAGAIFLKCASDCATPLLKIFSKFPHSLQNETEIFHLDDLLSLPLLPFLPCPLPFAYEPAILNDLWLPSETLFSSIFLPLCIICLVSPSCFPLLLPAPFSCPPVVVLSLLCSHCIYAFFPVCWNFLLTCLFPPLNWELLEGGDRAIAIPIPVLPRASHQSLVKSMFVD